MRVISAFTLGKTITNTIGSESVWQNGIIPLTHSEQLQVNIPRRVTTRWYARSNQSGHFYNASHGIWGTRLWEWRRLSGKTFCLVFYSERKKFLSPIVGSLSTTLVKKAILELLNPVTSAKDKCLSSQQSSAKLIWAVTEGGKFSNADHLLVLREERREGQKNRYDANDAKIKVLVGYLIGINRRLILRAKNTGSCLNVRGTAVTVKVFSAT